MGEHGDRVGSGMWWMSRSPARRRPAATGLAATLTLALLLALMLAASAHGTHEPATCSSSATTGTAPPTSSTRGRTRS